MTRKRVIVQPDGSQVEQPTGPHPDLKTCVAALMSKMVYCVREEVPIDTITELLLERGFSAVPVVDQRGRPRGIVSKTDLLRHAHERGTGKRAGEVMMPMVFVVDQRSSIGDAAALMASEDVHRIPVTDSAGVIVGILSSLDLVRWLGQLSGYAV